MVAIYLPIIVNIMGIMSKFHVLLWYVSVMALVIRIAHLHSGWYSGRFGTNLSGLASQRESERAGSVFGSCTLLLCLAKLCVEFFGLTNLIALALIALALIPPALRDREVLEKDQHAVFVPGIESQGAKDCGHDLVLAQCPICHGLMVHEHKTACLAGDWSRHWSNMWSRSHRMDDNVSSHRS